MKDIQHKNLAIVIPCYNEVSAIPVLESLKATIEVNRRVDIYLVFNASKTSSKEIKERNLKAYEEIQGWVAIQENLNFRVFPSIHNDIEDKIAGVGMARKLGMDTAVRSFENNNEVGIIACLDADCTVEKNYLKAITAFFEKNKKTKGCSIYFEHRFDETDRELHEAIQQYEIHLRYFKQALSFCTFPYAYHTVGSSMAVLSDVYLSSKGMNTKKAGEDFYFLQKIFSQYEFGEINTTTVYPLGRVSDRVPFGTGAAMNKWKIDNSETLQTYSLNSFKDLRQFFLGIRQLKDGNEWLTFFDSAEFSIGIKEYLEKENFYSLLEKLIEQSPKLDQLESKFFRWFNNFRVLKCLNYLRDTYYPQANVLNEANDLLILLSLNKGITSSEILDIYRKLDKLANESHTELKSSLIGD